MNRRTMLGVIAAALAFATVAVTAAAQPQWVLLGRRTVNILAETDNVPVTATQGRFDHIGLRVYGNDLYVFELRVIYGNGSVDVVPIAETIPQGGQTREIDLAGGDRFITAIVISYRRPLNLQGETVVEFWGQR